MSYLDILMSRGRQGTLFDQLAYHKIVGGGGGGTLIGTDTEPYQYRSSPSLGDYKTERDEIVGVSVGFNQLVKATDTSVTVPSGHKYIAKINGTWSVGTSSGTALTVDGSNNDMVIDLTAMLGSTIADYIVTQGNTNGVAFFRKYFGADYYPFDSGSIRSVEGLVSHDMVGKNLFDADTVLTDAGFTKQTDGLWYRANLNGLLGRKLWENNLGYDGDVCISYKYKYANGSSSAGIRFKFVYADGGAIVDYPTVTTDLTKRIATSTSGSYHGRVVAIEFDFGTSGNSTWLSDVQIEIGTTATDYAPYEKHSYPLDSTVTLRGKLDLVDGKFKANGDVYPPSGGIARNYAEVDLGSLDWNLYATSDPSKTRFITASAVGKPSASASTKGNIVCAKYVNISNADAYSLTTGIAITQDGKITVYDPTYETSTASAFKSAMNGVMLVYEKNEPTTDTAQPYAKNQKVSPSGTEEYVASEFNVWDEEWESGYFDLNTGQPTPNASISRSKNFIPIVANTTYYYKSNGANHTLLFYDADKNYIGNNAYGGGSQTFTTPNNARYMKFAYVGNTYNHDICINLSDPSRNGQYVPHGSIVPVGHNTEYYG